MKYLGGSQGSWQQSKFRWTQTSFPPGLRVGQGWRQALGWEPAVTQTNAPFYHPALNTLL